MLKLHVICILHKDAVICILQYMRPTSEINSRDSSVKCTLLKENTKTLDYSSVSEFKL